MNGAIFKGWHAVSIGLKLQWHSTEFTCLNDTCKLYAVNYNQVNFTRQSNVKDIWKYHSDAAVGKINFRLPHKYRLEIECLVASFFSLWACAFSIRVVHVCIVFKQENKTVDSAERKWDWLTGYFFVVCFKRISAIWNDLSGTVFGCITNLQHSIYSPRLQRSDWLKCYIDDI